MAPAERSARTEQDGFSLDEYTFDSADPPPAAAMVTVAAKFPELAFVHAHVDPACDDGAGVLYVGGEFQSEEVVDPESMDPFDYESDADDAWYRRVEEVMEGLVDLAVSDLAWKKDERPRM